MKLTKDQETMINQYIFANKYTFTLDHVLEEYRKWKNGYYISRSFKKVIENFPTIFIREL